jgi:bifunctional DNA-binding transcriptional regulator/antitoxin component of YhaV-PrlF toxin-antitoxin module
LPRQIRRAANLKPGDVVSFQVTGQGTVEIRALPRLRLHEALERYRIDGPVDDSEDRTHWQAEASQDVLGSGHE